MAAGVAPSGSRWQPRHMPVATLAGFGMAAMVVFLAGSAWSGWELLRTAATGADGTASVAPLWEALSQRYLLLGPLLHSLALALPVSILATGLGAMLAWLIQRSDFPGGALLLPLVALPHVIPGFQLGSAWVEIMSHGGLWQALTGFDSPFSAYGYIAMVAVITLHLLLFPFLIVSGAFQAADPALEEAARIGGLSQAQVFWRVTLPLARPALWAAALLIFAYVMGEFGIPSLLGTPSGFDTLTTRIYGLVTTPPLDLSGASVLALALGLIALGVLLVQLRLQRGQRLETLGGKASRQSRQGLGKWRKPIGILVWVVMIMVSIAPLLTLMLVSLLASWGNGYGPGNWTLSHYALLLHDDELRRSLCNSLLLGAGTAAVVMALVVAVVYGAHRLNWRVSRLADRVSFVMFAVPGLVVGLAAVLAFSGGWLPLYGTPWILLVAYALRFSGIGVRAVSARLSQIAVELESAAQVAGLSRIRLLARIVLPLLGPALVSTMALVFINVVKDISATSVLASHGSETLAFEAYLRFQEGSYTQGSAISMVMILMVLAIMGLGRWLGRGKLGVAQS